MTDLQPDATYYFAIKAVDEWPNASAISNVVTVTMPPADTFPPYPTTDLSVSTASSQSIALELDGPGR